MAILPILSSRWAIFAKDKDDAYEAIKPWRGLRVENRLLEVDPSALREKADHMGRDEILGSYEITSDAQALIQTYAPLLSTLKSTIVMLQVTSIDQEKTIEMLGKEVLPQLRKL